jgi:chemotaxis protein methyltransferase WspC
MPSPSLSDAVRAAEVLLRHWIGLDVTTIGRAALERAVRIRMADAGVQDVVAFIDLLESDSGERDRLVEEIVVAESWFFREPRVFDLLGRFAVARAGLPQRGPLRVLCAPCAAGEEPYSVAMTLLEAGLPASSFTIDAVDVSRACLARAAAATYPSNAFRNADHGFRDRWFLPDGAAARLHDAVRTAVNFSWGNVLDESFATGRAKYDVVLCRNLLIYLTAEARTRVERALDGLLMPDGILVLGAAEPAILRGPWIPAAEQTSCVLRRGPRATASPADGHGPPRPAVAGRASVRPAAGPPGASTEDARPVGAVVARLEPPGTGTARPVAAATEHVVREAGRLANLGRHGEALRLCQGHERESGPSADVFFLMAMIHQSAGDHDRAEGCLHRTLSLDPGHEDALLSLALAASRRGDTVMAEHYRKSAARAFSRRGSP